MSKKEFEQDELEQLLKEDQEAPSLSDAEEKKIWKKIREKGGNKELEEKMFKIYLKTLARKVRGSCWFNNVPIMIKEGKKELKKAIRDYDHSETKTSFPQFFEPYFEDAWRNTKKTTVNPEESFDMPDDNKELLLYGIKNGKEQLIAKIHHKQGKIIVKGRTPHLEKEITQAIEEKIKRKGKMMIEWSKTGPILHSQISIPKKLGEPGFLDAIAGEFMEPLNSIVSDKKIIDGYEIMRGLTRIDYHNT